MPQKKPRLAAHFVGIGGIGISALARWFLAQNWRVSGSDIRESLITKELRKEGVRVKIGHKKANVPRKIDMAIYSTAVPLHNPEIQEARRRGIKPLSYPATIGCITEAYKTIAVAGSHGKGTTASMIGLILEKAGFDPNMVVGVNLKWLKGKNFRKGKSKWLVLEADEFKRAFHHYDPLISVVTNIDNEHLDIYKNLSEVKRSFLVFLERTSRGGILVLNRDDRNLYSLHSPISQIAKRKSLKVFWYSSKIRSHPEKIRAILRIPGQHNVSNALAAYTVATKVLKIKQPVARKALSLYGGASRRMEHKGKLEIGNWKLEIFDDYAHHPTEIRATLNAFKEKFPKRKIICVYQPHQAKRLQVLFKEFQSAFLDADALILLPVYEVAGRDKVTSRFTSKKLADAIQKKHPTKEVMYENNPLNIRKVVSKTLNSKPHTLSPIIVMMGAGDIVNYTPLLLGKRKP